MAVQVSGVGPRRQMYELRAPFSGPKVTSALSSADCPACALTLIYKPAVPQLDEVRMPDALDLLLLVCVHGLKPDLHSACRWVSDAVTVVRTATPPLNLGRADGAIAGFWRASASARRPDVRCAAI